MKDSEALIAARALIQDEAHWTQRNYFAYANHIPASSPESAVRYCMVGALLAATGLTLLAESHDRPPGYAYLADECEVPATFNDMRSHAEVLQVYDRAIANALRAEGKAGWRRFLPWTK